MKTGQICSRNVVVARRSTTLEDAAKLMRENHVGCVVVLEGELGQVPAGIVTDRDIVVEAVAAGLDARALTVGDIMSERLVIALDSDDAHATLSAMRRRGIRRMPVVGADRALAGIVTLDDLIAVIGRELMDVVQAIGSEQQLESWRRPERR